VFEGGVRGVEPPGDEPLCQRIPGLTVEVRLERRGQDFGPRQRLHREEDEVRDEEQLKGRDVGLSPSFEVGNTYDERVSP
jgi:hypothetical protein